MRIAILDMDDLKNPHWGSGQAKVTREVFKRMAKENEVTVYSSKYPGSKDYREDNITYKHIGLGTNNPKINNIAYIFSVPFFVFSIKADLILENFTAPISTLFTPLFTNIPVVGVTSFFSPEEKKLQYGLPFDKIEKFGLGFYKYIIALNKNYARKVKLVNKKIIVKIIPNGIDDIYFKIPTVEKNYILYLGRLDINQKGIDLLIKAFSIASKKIEDELYIVGYGSKKDELQLKNLIADSPAKNRIKFLGKKTGKEKIKIQSSAKIIVFPSRYEGHSLSALEALTLGKPIICFDIPGFDWLNKNTSIKVEPNNIINLSKSIQKLTTDKNFRAKLSKNEKKLSKKYTWDKAARDYEELFKKII